MRRDFALNGSVRQTERPARSIACLVFVAILGSAFWAAALWIGETLMHQYGQSL